MRTTFESTMGKVMFSTVVSAVMIWSVGACNVAGSSGPFFTSRVVFHSAEVGFQFSPDRILYADQAETVWDDDNLGNQTTEQTQDDIEITFDDSQNENTVQLEEPSVEDVIAQDDTDISSSETLENDCGDTLPVEEDSTESNQEDSDGLKDVIDPPDSSEGDPQMSTEENVTGESQSSIEVDGLQTVGKKENDSQSDTFELGFLEDKNDILLEVTGTEGKFFEEDEEAAMSTE